MNLVALQEVRWPYCGKVNTEQYTVYYSGTNDGTHRAGVGFALNKKLLRALLNFEAISERLCMIRLRGKFKNISVIGYYAPKEDGEEDEKDIFYGQLEELYNKIPNYDVKTLMGEANTKIGKEYIGTESLHNSTSENGVRLLSFAFATNLKVMSTVFPHKGTWASSGGRV